MKREKMSKLAVSEINTELLHHLGHLKVCLDLSYSPTAQSWEYVENFCAVSAKVLSGTNPSKVRNAAAVVELSTRLTERGL
jgi:hypothetical protein